MRRRESQKIPESEKPSPKNARLSHGEFAACRPWLEAELQVLKPELLICLGVTAAQALIGKYFKVSRQRGRQAPSPLAPYVMATVHPSSILRAPDEDSRHAQMKAFVADLKIAVKIIRGAKRRKTGAQKSALREADEHFAGMSK